MQIGPIAGLLVVAFLPLVITSARITWIARSKVTTALASSPTASLTAAKAANAQVAFAIRFGAISLGWVMFCFGASPWALPYEVWPVQFFSIMQLWPLGGTLMLLSVRPTDKIAIIVATPLVQLATWWFGLGMLSLFFALLNLHTIFTDPPRSRLHHSSSLAWSTSYAALSSSRTIQNYFLQPSCHKAGPPRVRLNRLWRSLRIFLGAMFPFFAIIGVANLGANETASNITASPSANDPHGTRQGDFTYLENNNPQLQTEPVPQDAPGAFACALVCITLAIGMKPFVRRRFHAFLGSLASKGEANAAAAVAGLVGNRSPQEALKHASETFRALPYSSLSEHDFTTSGDTGLHDKTVKATLGDVDAFLSHSWHDDASQKWEALQTWNSGKGKGATVWLDKACINQQMIDESLAALPVYLSGCKSLLVVAGATYSSRLWVNNTAPTPALSLEHAGYGPAPSNAGCRTLISSIDGLTLRLAVRDGALRLSADGRGAQPHLCARSAGSRCEHCPTHLRRGQGAMLQAGWPPAPPRHHRIRLRRLQFLQLQGALDLFKARHQHATHE